jgi:hypothetical protein
MPMPAPDRALSLSLPPSLSTPLRVEAEAYVGACVESPGASHALTADTALKRSAVEAVRVGADLLS